MNMSPEPPPRKAGIPLERSRICRPDCEPAGIFTRERPPSIVGTSISPPSAAVAMLSGKADACACLDPCGDVDGKRAVLLDTALAAAFLTGVLDDLAEAGAGRAGALDREEALLRTDLAHARAGRAGGRLGTALGPRPVTGIARHRRGHVDRFLKAAIGFFQRHAQIVAQVGATRGTLASSAALAAHEVAEEVVEDIREGGGKVALAAAGTATASAHAALEGRVAETVIG